MKTILKTSLLFPILVLGLLVFSGCSDDPASSGPTPPACSIVYPTDGQSVTDTVMVEIRAEDEIAVTQVLLYIDGALVYETIAAPYQYSWNTRVYPDSSEHRLYAVAWNQDSLSTVSDTINVIVDHFPPVCEIINPTDGQSVTDTVLVEIRAVDDIAVTQVFLYIDGALVYETIAPPYQYSWNTRTYPDSSEHQLYAVAMNEVNLSTRSETVNVIIDYSAGAGQHVLVVANQFAGTLSMIDLYAGGAVERDIIGVGNVANDIIFANGRLHVINSLSHDMNVISLSYSGEMVQVVSPIDLGINQNRNPMYGSLAANGFLYISNGMTDDITVFDLDALSSRIRSDVGVAPAGVLAVGGKVYVCNTGFNFDDYTYGMGSVSIIDTTNNMERIKIEIGEGKNPQFMALDPTGKIHVVCTGNYVDIPGEIQVIDPLIDGVTNYIYIGGTPGDIAINFEGIAFLTAGGLTGAPDVYRYNAITGQVLNGPSNPIMVSAGAMRVVAASDNSVYVACFNAGTIDKIFGGVRVETFTVGDGPAAMVIVER